MFYINNIKTLYKQYSNNKIYSLHNFKLYVNKLIHILLIKIVHIFYFKYKKLKMIIIINFLWIHLDNYYKNMILI